jgi:photosystem II stability/assembly factor-like uncharacterized protein
MRRRNAFSIALIVAVATSAAATEIDFLQLLLTRRPPRYDSLTLEREDPAMTEGREAMEWRLSTMRDDDGRIEPDAILRASLHRRENLRAQKRGRIATDAASISSISWVSRGPQNVGGRTLALLVDVDGSGNRILYAGSASGGIWKSTDGGQQWSPLNEFMDTLAIGSLAFNPLDHHVIYAGTGERQYDRDTDVPGIGICRSLDGGATWQRLNNPANWTYVSSIAPQPGSGGTLLAATDKGIYRSTNQGDSWSLVSNSLPAVTRAIAVAFDPTNGMNAIAAIERPDTFPNQTVLETYYSTDGGLTFTKANGATDTELRSIAPEIALAYAPSDPAVVYVAIGFGILGDYTEVWRSQDGGRNYTKPSPGTQTNGQPLRDGCISAQRCNVWISPTNADVVMLGGLNVLRSVNGGQTFQSISESHETLSKQPHVDQHCIVADPAYNEANRRVYLCNDGGVWRTDDIITAAVSPPDLSWKSLNRTYQTTQFFSGIGDVRGDGAFLGGTQDNGVEATTSLSNDARIAIEGDGASVEIEPTDPNVWYAGLSGSQVLQRSLNRGQTWSDIAEFPSHPDPTFTDATVYVPPFLLDPNQPRTLLFGSKRLFRTTNAAGLPGTFDWRAIRTGSQPISAIAVAPGNSNLIWVAQRDGVIEKTTTGAADVPTWFAVDNNGTVNPLPPRYVTRILIDPSDNNTVYVALGGYVYGNLLKTTDGGVTFTSVSGSGVTALPPAPVRAIARHPRNAQRLYAGTDVGIYESENGGATWSTSHAGPANVAVDDLRFLLGTAYGNEVLLAATHGRGLWTHDVSSVPTLNQTPVSMTINAIASTNTTVALTWNTVPAATSYDILRRTAAGTTTIHLGVTTSYSDSVSSATSYLYKVKAFAGTTLIGESTENLATTVMFTDDNALLNKLILTTHIQELRTAVNAVRALNAGLNPLNSTNVGKVLAQDLNDLRGGLNEAFPTIGFAAPFSGTINVNALIVPSEFQQIRDAVK